MTIIENILKLISDYGFPTVACVVACYFLYKLVIAIFDRLKENEDKLLNIIECMKKVENKDVTGDDAHNIRLNANINKNIINILFEIKAKLKCSQINIHSFHNSTYSLNGTPYLRYTTCFSTSNKIIQQTGIPISLNALWINLLSDDEKNYDDNNLNSSDIHIISYLNSFVSHQIISIKLIDENDRIIGVLDMHFNDIYQFNYADVQHSIEKIGVLL